MTYTAEPTALSVNPVPPATANNVEELGTDTGPEYKVPVVQPDEPLVAGAPVKFQQMIAPAEVDAIVTDCVLA